MYRRRRRYSRRSAASRRRRIKMRSLYNPKNSSNSKVFQTMLSFGGGLYPDVRTRILYSNALTLLPHGNERNTRYENVVNVGGIKLQGMVANLAEYPIIMNLAIVHPRSLTPTTQDISATQFFRDYGPSRATNFGTNLNCIQMTTNPINTDMYTVLWRKRKLIPNAKLGDTNPFDNQSKSSYIFINKYIPIKRQLRFENDSSQDPEDGHLILVMWYDALLDPADTAASTEGKLRCQFRNLLYFREGRR